ANRVDPEQGNHACESDQQADQTPQSDSFAHAEQRSDDDDGEGYGRDENARHRGADPKLANWNERKRNDQLDDRECGDGTLVPEGGTQRTAMDCNRYEHERSEGEPAPSDTHRR